MKLNTAAVGFESVVAWDLKVEVRLSFPLYTESVSFLLAILGLHSLLVLGEREGASADEVFGLFLGLLERERRLKGSCL